MTYSIQPTRSLLLHPSAVIADESAPELLAMPACL
jgi:hypothetical protein